MGQLPCVPLAAIAEKRGVAGRTVQRHHRRVLDVLRKALIRRGVAASISTD